MLGLSAALLVGNAVADGPCWADERCVRITGVGLAAVRPDDERPHNLKQLAAIRAADLVIVNRADVEGALDAMSIGYRTIKAQWDEEQGIRKLLDLDLWEVSIVTFPMNEMATVDAVKNDLTITDVERILREGGAPGAFAKLVAIHGFEGATKRLGSRREGGESSKTIAEMIRETSANMKGMAK